MVIHKKSKNTSNYTSFLVFKTKLSSSSLVLSDIVKFEANKIKQAFQVKCEKRYQKLFDNTNNTAIN